MAKKPTKKVKGKVAKTSKKGGGGLFKRDAEKKRAAEERKAQKKAEREAERKRKQQEKAKEKAEKDAKDTKATKDKKPTLPGLVRPKPAPSPSPPSSPLPAPPKSPLKPPIKPGPSSPGGAGRGKTLVDLFGSKYATKDQLTLGDKVSVSVIGQPPNKLAMIADQVADLPNRPTLSVQDWRADDRLIRANVRIAKAQDSIAQLRSDIPLLLMPLRLETRFTSTAPYALQLRVFPDQIALDGLERALSPAEVERGTAFLDAYDAAKQSSDKQALWADFSAADPWRAAWIVKCLRSGTFRKRRADKADAPAKAPLLPDCWLVTGKAGGVPFHAAGNSIPRDLAFSPDLAPEISPKGDLSIDPAVNWMIDYEEAVRKGMALTIPLPDKAQDRIDQLFVVGITTQGDAKDNRPLAPARAAQVFEDLLEAHNYDWGGGFVPAGTPTNNTNSVRSDWSFNKPDLEALRLRELEPGAKGLSLPEIADDGDRALRPIDGLAARSGHDTMFEQARRAFGLSKSSVLSQFEHRQGTERSAARAMNRLLWPVTLGEMFTQLLHGPQDIDNVPPEVTDFMRDWFCEDLTGGNALPAIRSAATTYGVLAIESFTRRRKVSHKSKSGRQRAELQRRLHELLPEWQAAVSNVLRLAERPEKLDGFDHPTDRFLGMLKQDSSPAGFAASNIWNTRGLPQALYTLGEKMVHPKHDPVDVREAFLKPRTATFKLKPDRDIFLPAVFKAPEMKVSLRTDTLLAQMWEAEGYTNYADWPASYRNGAHQEQVLREKIDLLEATLDINSDLYGHDVDVPMNLPWMSKTLTFKVSRGVLFEALAGQVEDHLRTILNALIGMRDFVIDHRQDNAQFLQAFEPPTSLYKGVVGEDDIDPRLSWLVFYEATDWPSDELVEVDRGAQTITTAAYLDELKRYAASQKTNSAAPPRTQFPGHRVPLLYSLLRTAIDRVAAEPDKMSAELGAEIDRQVMFGPGEIKLEPGRISDLSRQIKGVGKKGPASATATTAGRAKTQTNSVSKSKSDALARTLQGRDPAELRSLSKQLRIDSKANAKKSDYPSKEAIILADELDRVAKLKPEAIAPTLSKSQLTQRSRRLGQMEQALSDLAKLNAGQVELLMQQTLGLASWRLDAWLTSLTTKRLMDLRAEGKPSASGLQIGAFGWVEDLRRDPRGARQAHEVRSQGFIHTPSLNHAKAAAVLRAGWNAYGDDRDASPLAVDLSSERMRFAERAFAAISRGQDPGDLLGREFERALRYDFGASEWIYPVRQAVLTMAREEPDPTLPVVDGLELRRQWEADPDRLQELAKAELQRLGASDKLEFVRVTRAYKKLIERIDALADAGLSEAMFALVQGNLDRAGAQLSAISDGIQGPSDLQMLSTAPATVTQVHRVVMLKPEGDGWIGPDHRPCPLASADPTSEAIASHWIGKPGALRFRYDVREPDGMRRAQGEVSWADLLDSQSVFAGGALLAMKSLPDTGWSEECELAMRLKGFVCERDPGLLQDGALSVKPHEETEALLEMMSAWRETLFAARALHPRDCGADIDEGTASLNLGALEDRAAAAETAWLKAKNKLLATLPKPVEGNPTPVGTASVPQIALAIRDLVTAGWSNALPAAISPFEDRERAYEAAWSLAPKLRETAASLREISAEKAKGKVRQGQGGRRSTAASEQPQDDSEALARQARAKLKLLLGAKLAFATDFVPADPAGVAKGIKAAPSRTQESALDKSGWLEKMAYVREPLRRLNDAILLAECAGLASNHDELSVVQWPNGGASGWIATAPPPDREGPSVSWLMVGPVAAPSATTPVSGLVIDEVIDKVPATKINTGVALHFDAPNCEAPQTLLLALPPEGEAWSHEVLLDTLADCFAMAKMRPVDSDAMPDFNSILPSIFANNDLKPRGDNG